MMGRAKEDDGTEVTKPTDNGNDVDVFDEAEFADGISEEDMERLSNQLDSLNSALDVLEQENENIQARLLELLQSSREERMNNHATDGDR